MGALPPPPPEPGAWGSGPTPAPVAPAVGEDLADRPAWRQGRPGWTILHLAIALGLALAGLFAVGIVVAVVGRDERDLDLADETQTGLAWLVLWVGCLVGWILFAYQRGTPRRRWLTLGGVAGGAWFLALALVLAATD
ncbi:MAG TPA: hypothetical protein VIB62_03290 [Actinomycetota bacterium]